MEKSNLLRHTILFSVFVLLAQVIGLVRDLYMARIFGVGEVLDVYYMAFKIPDFLNVFYSVFLGSVVFIPLLTLAKNSEGQSDNRAAVVKKVKVIGSLVISLVFIAAVVLFILAPYIAPLIAPTWTPAQLELLTNLSRILLIAQFFFPIGILAGSICMIYNKPFYMAVSGFIYNLFILLGALFLVPLLGIYGVVIGVVLGALSFALIQSIPREVREIYSKYRYVFNVREWFSFFRSNFSRFFAVVAYQLFGVLLLYIATFSGTGGVSIFSISYNIFLAFFFILGASLSTAAMPNIARLHVTGDTGTQKTNLNNTLVYMFFVGCFITLFGYLFSLDVVKILYYFSHLELSKEISIGIILALLMLSLPFFNLLEVIRKYLYSTNQIPFAGLMTIILLVGVLVSSVFMNKLFGIEILHSLAYSILLSNVACLLLALLYLEIKNQISLATIFSQTYKVIIISLISFVSYVYASSYLSYFPNYFADLITKGLFVLLVFILLTYIFNDKIGKNIIGQIKRVI